MRGKEKVPKIENLFMTRAKSHEMMMLFRAQNTWGTDAETSQRIEREQMVQLFARLLNLKIDVMYLRKELKSLMRLSMGLKEVSRLRFQESRKRMRNSVLHAKFLNILFLLYYFTCG